MSVFISSLLINDSFGYGDVKWVTVRCMCYVSCLRLLCLAFELAHRRILFIGPITFVLFAQFPASRLNIFWREWAALSVIFTSEIIKMEFFSIVLLRFL